VRCTRPVAAASATRPWRATHRRARAARARPASSRPRCAPPRSAGAHRSAGTERRQARTPGAAAPPTTSSQWTIDARVNIDYHIDVNGHYYSVPHPLLHELVDARRTATTVEIFHRGQRVAAHVRNDLRGRHTTNPAHMPQAHREHLEWSPSRLIDWARTIGPQTAALVEAILAGRSGVSPVRRPAPYRGRAHRGRAPSVLGAPVARARRTPKPFTPASSSPCSWPGVRGESTFVPRMRRGPSRPLLPTTGCGRSSTN
jgi:hypothetical protein